MNVVIERRAAVLALLVACGRIGFDPLPSPAPDHSGARLKVVSWRFADGGSIPYGLYDSERDERCALEPWDDGATYCSPTNTATAGFLDGSCTQPVAANIDPACDDPAYVAVFGPLGQTGLYELGSAVAGTEVYQLFGSACTGPFDGALFDFGAEVPRSALAAVVETAPTGAGPIQLRDFASSDGFVEPDTLYDATAGSDCVAFEAGPQVTTAGVCVSQSYGVTGAYHDAACSQPIISVPDGLIGLGDIGYLTSPGCLDQDYVFAPVAGPVGDSIVYGLSAGTCTQVTPIAGATDYLLGAPVDPPALARGPSALAQRIRPVDYTADGVAIADPTAFYDAALGVACQMQLAADGVERCLPADAVGVEAAYADAGCTVPRSVVAVGGVTGCAPPAVPRYAVTNTSLACGFEQSVFAVGSTTGSAFFLLGSACMPITPSANGAIYVVGAEVAPATFAAGSSEVAP